jgi:hypothetical protein
MYVWMGWYIERDCILVTDVSALVWSLIHAGCIPDSISIAAVGVVLKHPKMAFIAMRWTVVNFRLQAVADALRSAFGRFQMMAASLVCELPLLGIADGSVYMELPNWSLLCDLVPMPRWCLSLQLAVYEI